jgi:hypothetical protein
MLLEHRARRGHTGPLVFATRSGRAIGQRNLLRALCTAQERARTRRARRLSPSCSSTTSAGTSWSTSAGEFVPRRVDRREPKLPDFHALRHTAAMDCDDADEARDLLRHRNSNVTRPVYRAHFSGPATLTAAGEDGGALGEQGAERAAGRPARRGRPARTGELRAPSMEAVWKRQTAARRHQGVVAPRPIAL